jgi:hypothetical protein
VRRRTSSSREWKACSSSSKPKTDSTKPLSKTEYIKQSDSICRSYSDRINSVVSASGNALTVPDAKKTFNDKLIPLFRTELAELRALRPPKKDAAVLDLALIAMSSGINTIIVQVRAADSIAKLDAIAPKGIARWKAAVGKYGMHVCGPVQK